MLFAPKEDGQHNPESFQPPEGMDRGLWEATHWLRMWGETLIQEDPDTFEHLTPIVRVLRNSLNPDLTSNHKGEYPLKAIAEHFYSSVGGRPNTFKTAIANETIERARDLLGERELLAYWWETFIAESLLEDPSSLTERGGTYRLTLRPGQESETGGAAELQQIILGMRIKMAENTAQQATTPLPHHPAPPSVDGRQDIKDQSLTLLQQIKGEPTSDNSSPPDWLTSLQPHLEPVTKIAILPDSDDPNHPPIEHTHDITTIIRQGETSYRAIESLDQVRLYRAGEDSDTAYYLDLDLSTYLGLKPTELQSLLDASQPLPDKLPGDNSWTKITSKDDLTGLRDNSPALSVSAGIYENPHDLLIALTRSGNSILHADYDHGQIKLDVNHVAIDAGPFKDVAFDLAYAIQHNRGDTLPDAHEPLIELHPDYHPTSLPDLDDIKALHGKLLDALATNESSFENRDNPTLLQLASALGFQDVFQRFKTLDEIDTVGMKIFINDDNKKFYEPTIAALDKFIDSHPSQYTPLGEEGQELLHQLVATKLQPQHLLEFATENTFGPTARTGRPLNHASRITNSMIPEDFTPNSNTHRKRWWTEMGLALINASGDDILQLGSDGWRPQLELLGAYFADLATYKMLRQSQNSSIGTNQRTVHGVNVQLDSFYTSRPAIHRYMTTVLGDFTRQSSTGYEIHQTSRDTLTPQFLSNLPIQLSHEFKATLEDTLSILPPKDPDKTKVEVATLELLIKWHQTKKKLAEHPVKVKLGDSRERINDALVLTSILLEKDDSYENWLRAARDNTPEWHALRLLILAGMRQLHEQRLKKSLLTHH